MPSFRAIAATLLLLSLQAGEVDAFTTSIRTPLKQQQRKLVQTPKSTVLPLRHDQSKYISLLLSSSPLKVVNSSTSADTGVISDDEIETIQESDAVVVGAGPAGLLTAIMLAQKYPDKVVTVYDRLAPPPSPTDPAVWSDVAKFYLIGLGSRGQNALRKYGVWDDVKAVCTTVLGRKDWAPEAGVDEGVERIFTDRPVNTEVLPRDKLVGVLHEHVIAKYGDQIKLNYGYEITPEDFAANDNTSVLVRVSKCGEEISQSDRKAPVTADVLCNVDSDDTFTLSTKLLIAADGTSRTVANAMEKQDEIEYNTKNAIQKLFGGKPFRVTRYVDDNKRVYKTVPMKLPNDWRPDLNYSARTKDGRINYDALPADRNGNYCGVFLVRENDEFATADSDPKGLRTLLDQSLPQFSALLDDETVASIAKKPPSYLPAFRYAGPRLNQGDHTLILGDCAHTVKPYFGLGANSALEDVIILDEALEEKGNIPDAVQEFSNKRAEESKALVKISRELDRPGKLGFITFILPIILDSIFHKLLPKVFAPNTISMLQKEGITFKGVQRRKRMDRIGQVSLLGMGGYAFTFVIKTMVKRIAKLTGKNSTTVVGAMVGVVLALNVVKKFAFFFNSNLAPADILAKNKDELVENETMTTKMDMRPNPDTVVEDGGGI